MSDNVRKWAARVAAGIVSTVIAGLILGVGTAGATLEVISNWFLVLAAVVAVGGFGVFLTVMTLIEWQEHKAKLNGVDPKRRPTVSEPPAGQHPWGTR